METKVTGQNLITLTEVMKGQGKKVSEICVAAGYKIGDKIHFTEYYTQLLSAQGKIKLIDEKIVPVINAEDPLLQDTIDKLLENYLENYPANAIRAFIELNGECYIESFESSYRGEYDVEDFAQEFYEEMHGDLPTFVVVDWEATWDNLRDDYEEQDGYIFYKHF
jgi:hypothetical protein